MSLPSIDPVTNYAKMAVAAVCIIILLGLLGVIGYLAYTKSRLETQLAQAQTSITALTDANADWKSKTDEANAALKSVNTAAAAREAAAAAAVLKAQTDAAGHLAKAQKIIALRPKAGVADCDSAKGLTSSYFGGAK